MRRGIRERSTTTLPVTASHPTTSMTTTRGRCSRIVLTVLLNSAGW